MKRALLWFFRLVQAMRSGTPPACRYLPTCSVYAIEAVEVHGAIKGSWLVMRRLGRCHPFGSHGLDPVPPASSVSSVTAMSPVSSASPASAVLAGEN